MGHKERAQKNYKKFHGRTVQNIRSFDFTAPKAVTFLGRGHAIEYTSDKILPGRGRKNRLYRHKFGSGVNIYLHPNGKSLLILGGKFRVTDWMRD